MVNKFRNEDEVKKALQKKVGMVNTAIWKRLVEDFYVNEVIGGESNLSWLVKNYRKFQELASEIAKEEGFFVKNEFPLHKKEGSSVITREDIIFSKALAYKIEKLPVVRKFRKEVLQGVLIKPENLKSWIQTMKEKDGPPTRYLKVKDSDVTVATEGNRVLMKGNFSPVEELFDIEFIELKVPGEGWVDIIHVNASGTLGQLKLVADKITKIHCPVWKEYQTVGFILTGKIPLIPKISYSYNITPDLPLQVTMKIDARITPKALSDEYTKIRKKLFMGKRVKPLQEKSLTLAEFFLDHEKNGFTWEGLMQVWNTNYPQWTYDKYSNFQKDCRRAINWLMKNRLAYKSLL